MIEHENKAETYIVLMAVSPFCIKKKNVAFNRQQEAKHFKAEAPQLL